MSVRKLVLALALLALNGCAAQLRVGPPPERVMDVEPPLAVPEPAPRPPVR